MKQIIVAVGTKNPCKLDAVRLAFQETFQDHEIVLSSHNVESGVSDQPFGDDETKIGATNRAKAAFDAAALETAKAHDNEGSTAHPDFGVGLEGGVEIVDGVGGKELWCMAFMVVLGSDSDRCISCKHSDSNYSRDAGSRPQEILGVAKTSSFQLPKKISKLVLEDHLELGHADDRVFNRVNSKQGSGTVGVLTNSMITRTLYYDHALKLALIPFMWPELYISF